VGEPVAFRDVDVAATWELFDGVAAAVRERLATSDLGAAGDRHGQYRLDVDADAVVVAPLVAAGFGVLSEESGRHHAERDVCVVVDPVDGSTNASRGLPVWATSLCAVDADGPAVATVVDQSRRVVYRAARGEGAWRSIGGGPFERIAVAPEVGVGDAVVALNGWSDDRPSTAQYRAFGAAAVELCLVADGSLDGYVNLDGDSHGSWDYLGGLLVLAEAGGVAADRHGRDLVALDHSTRRCVVAASGAGLLAAMMLR